MRMVQTTVLAAWCLGLYAATASAGVVGVSNGGFEADLGVTVGNGISNFSEETAVWFDENPGRGDFAQWEGANATIPDDTDGEVWGGLVTGGFYQAIGTNEAGIDVAIAFIAGNRQGWTYGDVEVSIWSGNVVGADGTALSALGGATQLDSEVVSGASLWADGGTGTAAQTAPVALTLNTGALGNIGDTLWVRFVRSGGTGAYLDDVVVTPEPASLTLLALGVLLLPRRRRA